MYELLVESKTDKIMNRLNALLHENSVEIIQLLTFHFRSGSHFPEFAILINHEPLKKLQENEIAEFSAIIENVPEKFTSQLNETMNKGFGWKLERCCQSGLMALLSRDMKSKLREDAHIRGIKDLEEMQRIRNEENAKIREQVKIINTFMSQTLNNIQNDIKEAISAGKYSECIRLWFIILENLAKFGVFIEFRHIAKSVDLPEYLKELANSWNINLEFHSIGKWKRIRNKIVHEYLTISKKDAEEGIKMFHSVSESLVQKINEFLKAPFEWNPKANPFSGSYGEEGIEDDDNEFDELEDIEENYDEYDESGFDEEDY